MILETFRRAESSLFVLLLVGCQKTPPAPSAPSASPEAVVIASVPAVEDAAPPPVAVSSDPYAELQLDEGERIAGFTADDKYVGYQISSCDPCPPEFNFRSPTLSPIRLSYYYEPGAPEALQERERKRRDEAVDRKLKSLGALKAEESRTLRGPFPSDLVFTTKTENGPRPGTKTVFVGAHVRGQKESVYPIRITLGPHPMFDAIPATTKIEMAKMKPDEKAKALDDWHAQWELNEPKLLYVNVTKDGTELAAVAVVTGSMWVEDGNFVRMKTADFVAKVRATP